jgi:hypothetical protein
MIRRIQYITAAALLAAPVFAGEPKLPTAGQISKCRADPIAMTLNGYFSSFKISCAEVRAFLFKAEVVSEWQWLHNYSHVAFSDRKGHFILRDGSVIQWMIRPGGLGYLEFVDGRKLYLASCCMKRPSNNAFEQSRGE